MTGAARVSSPVIVVFSKLSADVHVRESSSSLVLALTCGLMPLLAVLGRLAGLLALPPVSGRLPVVPPLLAPDLPESADFGVPFALLCGGGVAAPEFCCGETFLVFGGGGVSSKMCDRDPSASWDHDISNLCMSRGASAACLQVKSSLCSSASNEPRASLPICAINSS